VVQPTNHLGGRQINVLLQRCFQIRLRSVRISTAEKGSAVFKFAFDQFGLALLRKAAI
jgi:hypothetical protein